MYQERIFLPTIIFRTTNITRWPFQTLWFIDFNVSHGGLKKRFIIDIVVSKLYTINLKDCVIGKKLLFINITSTFRNENRATQLKFFPYNQFIKSSKQIFKDYSIRITHEIKKCRKFGRQNWDFRKVGNIWIK